MPGLARPVAAPVSQPFAGNYTGEPPGWFTNAKDGRPLRARRIATAGWIYHVDFHQGIDQYAALGTPLLAVEAGKVIFAGNDGIGGLLIRVAIKGHANARYSYDHCSAFVAKVGQTVARGQVIAKMGKTGNATGVHVHYQLELYENGRWVQYDPARFSPAGSFKLGSIYAYPALGLAKGAILRGGDLIYDDRIYPVHSATVNAGTNVRTLPDVTSKVIVLTTAPTPVVQLNAIPGGKWTVGATSGTSWAKVKLSTGQIGYVASPLIH